MAADASEADLEILEHQLKTAEPMTDEEKAMSISCDNTGEIDIDGLVKHIKNLAGASSHGKTDEQ
jgi:predicted kinase